ncbi:hypothetical protein OMK64_07400 [Cellulomonas fimi]|uniref:hypothetical protein n=1 Tax=Cellulomonas fimi TaxID=1708 RepID=UPI00234C0811|nr:hypothetical protein [Cellulomonas fimi]MDC7121359.1 hypothetical protein [Cellulomonas fimi]
MRTSRLLLRRARAQVGLLALVALLVAVVAATVAGTLAATIGGARDGARDALAAAGPDGALQVSTRRDADDPDGQRAAADDALRDALGDRPVHVSRTLRSLSLVVAAPDGSDRGVVLAAEPDLADVAHVVDGAWPGDAAGAAGTVDDPDPAALHAGAAEALGAHVGDTLVVTSDGGATRVLRVDATWRPDDPSDPRWAGDALVATGTGDAVGPAVVDERVLAAVPGIDLVRWTVVPALDRVGPGDLAPVADGLERFVADAQASVQSGGLSTSGALVDTLRRTDAALTAASAVTGAALALVAVVAVVALAQVARLLGAVRATETTVLRSRGTTVGQLTAAAAVEAVAVCVPPAVGGALVAAAVVGGGTEPAVVVAAVLAVAVAGLATLTLAARGAAARAGDRSDPAGRRSRTVATGGVVLVVLAAGLATWRLVRAPGGTAVSDGAAGGPPAAAEPAAVAAVPLGVLAVALLAAALLPWVTGAVARLVGSRPGLVVPLAARQVARRAAVYSVPVVLVTLATATGALAAVHVGTTGEHRRTAAAAATGADVRLVLTDVPPPDVDATPPTAGLGALPGADGVPVLRATAGSASRVGTLLALPADDTAAVRTDGVPGLRDALADLGPAAGWPVPAGTTAVRVTADVDGAATAARVWWGGPDGVLRATTATGAAGRWSAAPPGPGAWTVQGVELAAGGSARQVLVTEVVADGPDGPVDLLATGPWSVAVPGQEPLVVTADGPAVTLPGTGAAVTVVRVLPGAAAPLPLVVSADWAAVDGLAPGAPLTVRVDDHPVDAVVASVQPVVPGAPGRAALADLRAAGAALLATAPVPPTPTEVWYEADDLTATADAVRSVADDRGLRATVTTAAAPTDDPLTRSAGAALVVAAACALAVALPGVAAAVLALGRARRAEVGVLHALGVAPRTQARGRGAETGTVLGLAVAVGALGGLLLGVALGPALVRVVATGPAALGVAPAVQPGVLVALVGAAALGCALVALGDGARVRRHARTATVREDAR